MPLAAHLFRAQVKREASSSGKIGTRWLRSSRGSKPRTYMDQSPILAAIDLSPVQPQSSSQQDLSQDYRPASVSFLSFSDWVRTSP